MAKKKTTPVKKTNVTAKKTVNTTVVGSRVFNKVNIAMQLALGVAVLLAMKAAFYPLALSYMAKDALLSSSNTVFVPAERTVMDIDMRWILGGLLAVSAIYSLMHLTRWRASYEKALDGRIYLWRWVYLAATGTLLVKLASMVSGINDLATIKMSAALMVFAMAFAWLSERQNEKAVKPIGSAFVLSALSGLMALYGIISSLIGTTIFGMVRLPWYAYVIDAAVLIGFLLLMWNLRSSIRKTSPLHTYAGVERNYLVISMITIFVVVVTMIVAYRAV